ncbi:MAG: Lrp/AsnC ligand binding domain-containing protein [archaeon]|nr:Lrp/AsnC ligand binding domain-containing protein [archaeon]MCP8312847.1 Lrp/AsnC ligand binding domain-containing protein [archaeon]MCP8317004.1 Lrp/AsnC ligand binding domain-containing protein [archaeon]MCP8319666.1 Lrp/AsnC ligand binding domain-containing protein [archaeon]
MGQIKAVILAGLVLGIEDRVIREIKKFEGVKDGFMVYGEYDGVFIVEVPSQEKLNALISRIRRTEGVTRTITLVAI